MANYTKVFFFVKAIIIITIIIIIIIICIIIIIIIIIIITITIIIVIIIIIIYIIIIIIIIIIIFSAQFICNRSCITIGRFVQGTNESEVSKLPWNLSKFVLDSLGGMYQESLVLWPRHWKWSGIVHQETLWRKLDSLAVFIKWHRFSVGSYLVFRRFRQVILK